MSQEYITIKGAREHNLQNLDLTLPRNQLIVFTGVSGSGKSSLAFDTIFAEGQRRYVESLSAYARQFLGQMEKPDVEYIDGLSPAISIDQKSTSHNPRSTVGTVTEIYDYLRLLFAHIGSPHCPQCGKPITPQTIDQMADQIMALAEGTKFQILSPIVRQRKGEYKQLFADLAKEGFVRVRVDGKLYEITDEIPLDKKRAHNIEVVVDRLIRREGLETRLADSLGTALKRSEGLVIIDILPDEKEKKGRELLLSEKFACSTCNISFEEISPRIFSFNSPYGACPECHGLGFHKQVDPDLLIPDPNKSLAEGAIYPWAKTKNEYYAQMVKTVAQKYNFPFDKSFKDLPDTAKEIILQGSGGEKINFPMQSWYSGQWGYKAPYEGVVNYFQRRYEETSSDIVRQEIEEYMINQPCNGCKGTRLKKESLSVTLQERSIADLTGLSIEKLAIFFDQLKLTPRQEIIAHQVIKEIRARLNFLIDVGLEYLNLSRAANTLSGGEAQRIRLATQIGSGLTGVLYILDEPSIGLHQRDNTRLIATLKRLRDIGNTVIVVEHDEDTIMAANHIVDIGPGAGKHGGRVIAQGTLKDILASPESLTGQYLSRRTHIGTPKERRKGNGHQLSLIGAAQNNLKSVNLEIPLGKFVSVTGVSGSGKSTLVTEILEPYLRHVISRTSSKPKGIKEIKGVENLDKVITIDQSPIGRTPRSNPATYTGLFDAVRNVFSLTTEAKARGYQPGRFSFNVKGGRCEACAGEGMTKIEMHFLPDVYVPCEVCKGKRYNRETLEVRYKGKNIAEVLEMTVEEGLTFFENIPQARSKLETLYDVGLDYLQLGQPATTLSGGEAQRIKLATELSRRSTGKTLYILDEPTTGLHFADIHKLLEVLNRLVDTGNTVLVIEHNLDVIRCSDHLIDLGPEGGERGGTIVAQGTPEEVVQNEKSHTGRFLKKVL